MSPIPRNYDIPFASLILAMGVGLLLAAEAGVDPRLLSVVTGTIAITGLTYRLVTTWTETPVLVHVLALALIGLLLLTAIDRLQLLRLLPSPYAAKPPIAWVVWPGVALRMAVIVIAAFWPHWMSRRSSPFRTRRDVQPAE